MLLAHLEYTLDNSIMTQRTLRLRIGSSDVELACDRIAAKLRKSQPVAGFRKGKAPLPVVRKECWTRIAAEAFAELKRDALDQVLHRLEPGDQPLIPPEEVDADKIRVNYGRQLEFAVRYLIDPSGITKNPAHPESGQGAVMPGATVLQPGQSLAMPGAVGGVKIPAIPGR